MHKKIFILLLFVFMSLTSAFAQKQKFNHEAYKKEQRFYILKRVNMTPDEQRAFFNLYDEMRAAERQVFAKTQSFKNGKYPSTDAECRNAIIERDNNEIQLKKLQYRYHLKMLKVIPANKVARAIWFAEQFDREKFRQMNRENGKRHGNEGRGGADAKGGPSYNE